MQNNKLRMAIRATAAVTVLGLASQAQAFSFTAGDVEASIYGYARLNMSYDIDENTADNTQSGTFPDISDNDADGHFGASANQSRIGVRAKHASGVNINVEGDFLNGSLRLRHAYGEYNGILAGQTWSNYNTFVGVTPTLDFNGNVAQPGFQSRTAQLRYTSGPLSVSIEDPKGSVDDDFDADTDYDQKDGMPAFTARFEDSNDGLSYSAAALIKQNAYDTGTEDDSAIGYAALAALKVALSDTISIQGAVNYTDGANGYLYLSGGLDAYEEPNGDLETITGIGGLIGASFNLGSGRSVNVSYGQAMLDVEDIGPTAIETRRTAFVNYMWTPVQNVMMGVEYGYLSQETEGGDDDDANRLMFAAQYSF